MKCLLFCFLWITKLGAVTLVSNSDGCETVGDPMIQYTAANPFSQNWTATSPGDAWRISPTVPGSGVGPATEDTSGAWGQKGQWSDILVRRAVSPQNLTDVTMTMVFTPSNDAENDGIGMVHRWASETRYYLCYVTSDQSGDCLTQRTGVAMLTIAKVDTSAPCVDGYRLVTKIFTDLPDAYVQAVNTTMQFSIINNILTCTFDRNRDGVLNASDPIVTYNDSVNPLPSRNTRSGIYSYGWNGYIRGVLNEFCPPGSRSQSNDEQIASSTPVFSMINILYIAIGVLGLLLIVALIVIVVFIRRRKHRDAVPLASIGITNTSDPNGSIIADNWTAIQNVEIKEELGKGNFGLVFRGVWQGTEVALKSLKATHEDDFVREATVLQKLRHPNIVQYLGLFQDKKTKYIVMEYLPYGSLQSFLQKEEAKSTFRAQHLIALAKHAAAGMMHLEEKRMVHRDLALRNLLLGTYEGGYIAKISDFGLSRSIESSYYRSDADIPVKWSSPEVLEYGTHTSKSDVWSFGIVLWEMFSYGKLPYPEFTNDKTRQLVLQLYTMPPPPDSPESINELMNRCWAHKGDERPTFRTIFNTLDDIYKNLEANLDSPSATPLKTSKKFKVAQVDHLYGASKVPTPHPRSNTLHPMMPPPSKGPYKYGRSASEIGPMLPVSANSVYANPPKSNERMPSKGSYTPQSSDAKKYSPSITPIRKPAYHGAAYDEDLTSANDIAQNDVYN